LGAATAPELFDTYLTYTSPGYLSTFEQQWAGDNTSFVGWTGGYADQPTTASKYPAAREPPVSSSRAARCRQIPLRVRRGMAVCWN